VFDRLRGYAEGDDPRRIDWSATARIGSLQTRVYLEETVLVLARWSMNRRRCGSGANVR